MKKWKHIGGTVYRNSNDTEANIDTILVQRADSSYYNDQARQRLAERVTTLLNNDTPEGDAKLVDAIMQHRTEGGSRVGEMLTSEVTGAQLRQWLLDAIGIHANRVGHLLRNDP